MRSLFRRQRWVVLAAVVAAAAIALLAPALAFARPGGGQSYGGGGSSGGGSGDGAAGLIIELIFLCFRHPTIGVPLLIIVLVVMWVRSRGEKKQKAWATSAAGVPHVQQVHQAATGVSRADLDHIRAIDPMFSNVLFEDFVYNLYAELQKARAFGTASLAPYLAPQLQHALQDPRLSDVNGVIIGAMRIRRFSGVAGPAVQVLLEFETNYVEVYRQGGEQRFYAVDQLSVFRSRDAKSRPPERARTIDCPNCGASIDNVRGTHCAYCHEEVGGGRFDWTVDHFATISKQPRGPLLTSDVEEMGTDWPTRVDPGAHQRFQALQMRDPSFNWSRFEQRIGVIFGALQAGWSGRQPEKIRPYVSDNQFQSMLYWIELYTQNRCRNVNENARILRIDLANVISDATYDAITVRVFAAGLDYTISDDGKLMSGNRKKERTYSEYWTLIRGVNRKGESKGDRACPNCGADLKIGMAGHCEYCQVKITAGEFDWVLSRIEQDESYTG